MDRTNIGFCTVISKNYIAMARTLGESLHQHHSEAPFFVLLVDTVEDCFDPAQEPFTLLLAEDLPNLDKPRSVFFKYNILELNTAVKPFLFEHLLNVYNLQKLIYFDPDILVFAPLQRIWDLLESHSAVVTPHLTRPLEGQRHPNEIDILRAGTFNLGFLGLSDRPATREFLTWWQERLYNFCVMDADKGLFVDQKWVDLAPGMFPGFFSLNDSEYNVAYWNFHERVHQLEMRDESTVLLNGSPLIFFHFSGFDPERLESISQYQHRYRLSELPNLRPLYELYRDRLLAAGHSASRRWPYVYGFFDNEVRIPNIARKIYREMDEDAERFGDPFATKGTGHFFHWLTEGARVPNLLQRRLPELNNLWWEIYQRHPELQQAYPDPFGEDRAGFHQWIRASGREVYPDVADAFLPVEDTTIPAPATPSSHRIPAPLRRLARLPAQILLRRNPELLDRLYFWSVGMDRNPFRSLPRRAAQSTESERPRGKGLPFGVNVAGYLAGEFGIAEASRGLVHALKAAEIPCALNNIMVDNKRYLDTTFHDFTEENPYAVNLLTVNADMVPHTAAQKGPDWFLNRYNIGVWYWELPKFPPSLWPSFEPFQEIWVTSAFCAEAIAKVSPIPVVKITYPVHLDDAAIQPSRARFKIPEDRFAFVFSFDFHSFIERKNPFAVIEAFRQAFGSDRDALLVIKSINGDHYPEKVAPLKQAADGLNVHFLDEYLSRADTLSLLATCDCLVSLHRSEGLGLGMAEAMYLGKPVIATAYSGNTDFMDVNNSLPVKYMLVELAEDYGPYAKGNVWADADVVHAAEQMRWVYENREAAAQMGWRASEDIKSRMNPEVTGREMRARLDRIISG